MSRSTTTSLAVTSDSTIQENDLLLIDGSEERTAGVVVDATTTDIHDVLGDGSSVATYPLDGDVTDLGGTHNGTATDITYSAGKFGQAAVFNGTSSKIEYNIASLTGVKAVSAFVKLDASIDSVAVLTSSLSSNNDYYFLVGTNGNGNAWIGGRQGDSIYDSYRIASDTTMAVGEFYHLLFQLNVDGTESEIYINGVKQILTHEYEVVDDNFWFDTNGNADEALTGTHRTISPNYSTGLIDQLRTFNKTLSQAEVTTVYSEGYKTIAIDPALSIVPTSAKIVSQYADYSEGSYFENPLDTSKVQVTNANMLFSLGYDSDGATNSLVTVNKVLNPQGGWKI